MKRPLHTIVLFLLLAIPALWAMGCRSEAICVATPEKTTARILSISGPAHVRAGEQVTLTVAVSNSSGLCVKEANAYIKNTGLDTLLVTAQLSYLPEQRDCDCKRDSIIYTLLYFTPLNSGNYWFITTRDSSATSEQPMDIVDFTIMAD